MGRGLPVGPNCGNGGEDIVFSLVRKASVVKLRSAADVECICRGSTEGALFQHGRGYLGPFMGGGGPQCCMSISKKWQCPMSLMLISPDVTTISR